MLQFGMVQTASDVLSELILIFLQDNVCHVPLDLSLTLAYSNAYVQLTLLTLKTEDVLLANIQEPGTPTPINAFLILVSRTNTGTLIRINAHGALTQLLYGTEISVFLALTALSTLEIDMFAWHVQLVLISTRLLLDVFAQLTLLMFTITLVFNADTLLIGTQILKLVTHVPLDWLIILPSEHVLAQMIDQTL